MTQRSGYFGQSPRVWGALLSRRISHLEQTAEGLTCEALEASVIWVSPAMEAGA